ncbi:MAG: ABC transporter permease, partial [Mobilitalea sp.]
FLIRLLPPSRLSAGFLIAIALVVLMWFLLFKTKWGYEFRHVGQAPHFSTYIGISFPRTIISTMAISGAIAGIAGTIEVLGVHHRFLDNFSPGFGFTGIIVSLLGKANPIGDLLGGIFLGGLTQGALMMELNASIGRELVDVIKAVLFISLAAAEAYKPIVHFFSERKGKTQNA